MLTAAVRFAAACAVAASLVGCSDELGRVICLPGEIRCGADGVRVCAMDGKSFAPGSCADQQACVPGECDDPRQCPDVCKDIICTPGERLCLPKDNVFVYECDDTGTSVTSCGSCAAPPINGICYQGQCVSLCGAEHKSYIGCEYFAADLDNAYVPCDIDSEGNLLFCDAAGSQFAVVLSNPDAEFSAFVSITTGVSETQSPGAQCIPPEPDDTVVAAAIIPPKGIQIFELPRRDINGTTKAQLGFRIASNVPITAYQFNPLENVDVFSNDASLLLPTHAVGTDYFVMSREQTFDELKGQLVVVGIDKEPTHVTVTVTAKTLAGEGIPPLMPGESFSTTLRQYEVLSIESNEIGSDLTGSRVRASHPVVVFGASEAANVPTTSMCNLTTGMCEANPSTPCACTAGDGPGCNPHAKCSQYITCCADHLEQQMFPVSTWGSDYVAVRSFRRHEELDAWRILAAYNDTQVTIEGEDVVVPTLGEGQWFEFESKKDFRISATKPILVGQFLAAQKAPTPDDQPGDADIGDPAFMLAVPERQFRESYVFLAPNKYALDYVSLAVRDPARTRLDGQVVTAISNAEISPIADGEWTAVRIPIGDGFHVVNCPDKCGIMVHGYDQYVSYGYPGGLNLEEQEPPEQ